MQCHFAGNGFSPEKQKTEGKKNDYVIYWRGLRQKKKISQITIRILSPFDVAIRIFMYLCRHTPDCC